MQGFELLYLAMFILGFAGSGALVWWTRRRMLDSQPEEIYDITSEPAAREGARTGAAAHPRATPMEMPAITAEDLGGQEPIAQLIFAPQTSGNRECPTCHRRFDETTMLCPFDATPLQAAPSSRTTTRPAITGARRPTCHRCGRRYESSARFCYHDGETLSAESPAEVPHVSACRSCGFEALEVHAQCGCGEPDIVEIDPARADVQMPTIPMMQCRDCNHLTHGGETHCPNDGNLLYPVMNVSMNALPPTGIGPRRKICQKCGRKFATAARYCAYDGSKLEHLN